MGQFSIEPNHPGLVGHVSRGPKAWIWAGRSYPPTLYPASTLGVTGPCRGVSRDGPGWQQGGAPEWGVSLRAEAWRANEQSGADGGGACARVRRAAGRPTQAEAGVARTAGRRRAELAAGLAAVLSCQAVARLRPRAPPSRSAPSHHPVRARAEAAVRRSRFSGSVAAASARESSGSGGVGGVLRPGEASTCSCPPVGAR